MSSLERALSSPISWSPVVPDTCGSLGALSLATVCSVGSQGAQAPLAEMMDLPPAASGPLLSGPSLPSLPSSRTRTELLAVLEGN